MTTFEEQLLRLKQCLGVTKDVDVAAALGMTKAAFSNRKRLGSFPDEKVVMLKEARPDLDVFYVLTGERWSERERLFSDAMFSGASRRNDAGAAKSAAADARFHAQALASAARDPQVRELLGILMFCNREAIAQVTRFAARLMGKRPIPFDERGSEGLQLLSATLVHEGSEAPRPVSPKGRAAKSR